MAACLLCQMLAAVPDVPDPHPAMIRSRQIRPEGARWVHICTNCGRKWIWEGEWLRLNGQPTPKKDLG